MIKANQAISGKEGTVFVTIGNDVYEMAEVKSIEFRTSVITADVQAINMRMTKKKVTGMELAGDMTAHYFTNVVRKVMKQYKDTGVYPEIVIKVTNADVQAGKGRHTVIAKEVIFEESILARLDATADDTLEETTSLFAGDYDILEEFS